MLKQLRNKKTAKKIWVILAVVIVPAFVLWGSGSLIRSKQEATYAGKISGRKISFLEYKDALNAVKNAAIMKFGDGFYEMQKYLNLESQAWERLILLDEARRRKIRVSDREVVELIESYPLFRRKGEFDQKLYTDILRYVFHTQPRIYEEQTRQNLMLSKLYEQVTKDISLSEEEIRKEYRRLNEEVSVYYIAALLSNFAKDLNPSGQDIKDYFDKNKLQFKQPLSFNLDYIVLESEDKMKEVVGLLNKKNGFEEIAKHSNLSIKETGLFTQADPIPGIGWSPEILNLIAKFKVGELSPPIRAGNYYYILRLKERKEVYIPDFQKIKDKVREEWIKDESKKTAKSKILDCLEKLKEMYKLNAKQIDFNKIAKEYGLKSDSTNYFKYSSYIEGIGSSDSLWTAALELKEDKFSEIISMPSGFYIVKLKSRIPFDEKKFESEKTDYSERLLSQRKSEYFENFLKGLSTRAQ